jgi:hypothetical protein
MYPHQMDTYPHKTGKHPHQLNKQPNTHIHQRPIPFPKE